MEFKCRGRWVNSKYSIERIFFHTLIIIIAEKEIGIMARPPVDTKKQVGFTRRIFVLQPERVTEIFNERVKLPWTTQNITSRPKCRSCKLFLQFLTPLVGNRCRFCRATTWTAWRRPPDLLGHRRPTPDTRRCDTKPASSTFQTPVDCWYSASSACFVFVVERAQQPRPFTWMAPSEHVQTMHNYAWSSTMVHVLV